MKTAGPLLDINERGNAAWQKLKKFYEERLASFRASNDNMALTEKQTWLLRGRIAECKAILALDRELPKHEPDNPPDGA